MFYVLVYGVVPTAAIATGVPRTQPPALRGAPTITAGYARSAPSTATWTIDAVRTVRTVCTRPARPRPSRRTTAASGSIVARSGSCSAPVGARSRAGLRHLGDPERRP